MDSTMTNEIKLPDLPEWSKMDDLGRLVPSQVRQALVNYAREHEKNVRAALEAALAPTSEPADDDWLPIESAPRSGRQMILLLAPSRFPQVAFSNTWWTSGFSVECKPTHWIPIPELPTTGVGHE